MESSIQGPHQLSDPYVGKYEDLYLEVNGLRLHSTIWGDRSKPPALLVHGLNVQLHTWDPIAEALLPDYHVVCVDLRGHGDSQWAADGYAVGKFVSDIYELSRKLEIVPFDFVGHSLGSRIGIAYGGEHGDTLRHLWLSDTGPEVSREGGIKARAKVGSSGEKRGFRDEAEALAFFRELYPDWKPIFHDLHVKYQLRRNWAGKLVYKADPDLFWITGSVSLREVPYLWEMAAKTTIPTVIARGRNSYLLDEEITGRMLAVMANSREQVFETGHYIPREAPDEFVHVLREFLAT